MQKFAKFLTLLAIVSTGSISCEAGQRSSSFKASLTIGTLGQTSQVKTLRYTCGAAAQVILKAGYSNPIALTCSGEPYVFSAMLGDAKIQLLVDVATGSISRH